MFLGLGIGLTQPRRGVGVAPYSDVASGGDVLDWISVTGGGASGIKPRWPGVATTGNGLDTLHPSANWSVEGVDFSRDPSLPAMTEASTLPAWDAANNRLLMRNTTPVAQLTMSNVRIPGVVDINSSTEQITLDHCQINLASTYGINQLNLNTSPVLVRRCELFGQLTNTVLLHTGTIADSYMHDTRSDAIRLHQSGQKLVLRNMVRKLGQIDTGAHQDCIQTSGPTSNITTFGNMFYMPFSGGTYDEGGFGSTNVLRYATQGGTLSDILSVNDALIGGGYTVSLCPNVGEQINGAAIIGSWFAKPVSLGGAFTAYGSFYPGAATIGLTRNILIHNCRYLEDGSPVFHAVSGTSAQGLWDYDKSVAPARFKQVCQMLGYTDWNDDPLVTVRTGFHSGTVTLSLSALTGTFTLAEKSPAGTVAGTPGATTLFSALSLSDDAGGRLAISGGNVVAGAVETDWEFATSHSFTVRETLPGASNSPRDTVFTLTVTDVDDTPPVLSLPVTVSVGSTTARIGVTTDDGTGSLYWYISTSATPPDDDDLLAGIGALQFGGGAISGGAGAKEVDITSLTPSTLCYPYWMQSDGGSNRSTVLAGPSFTTNAPSVGPWRAEMEDGSGVILMESAGYLTLEEAP